MGLFSQPVGLSFQLPRQGHGPESANPQGLPLATSPFWAPLPSWPLAPSVLVCAPGKRVWCQETCSGLDFPSAPHQAVEIFIFTLTWKKGITPESLMWHSRDGTVGGQGIPPDPRIPPHPPSSLLVGCCPGGRPPSLPPHHHPGRYGIPQTFLHLSPQV